LSPLELEAKAAYAAFKAVLVSGKLWFMIVLPLKAYCDIMLVPFRSP